MKESVFAGVRERCGTRREGDNFTVRFSELNRAWMIAGDRHHRLYPTRDEAVTYANIMNRLWQLEETK